VAASAEGSGAPTSAESFGGAGPKKPPVTAELVWTGEGLQFGVTSARIATIVDGSSTAGASPVQMLVIGLAACMGMDVLDIVQKGRHHLTAFRTSIVAERQQSVPHRLIKASIHFHVHGTVPEAAVERAIALSRDKYCSVWQSLREDITLDTAYTIVA
jgi:putative redox protein